MLIVATPVARYLAEDRVLCFELLAKKNRDWTLHFVAGSVAETGTCHGAMSILILNFLLRNPVLAFVSLMALLPGRPCRRP
jgi:hypothetical protein